MKRYIFRITLLSVLLLLGGIGYVVYIKSTKHSPNNDSSVVSETTSNKKVDITSVKAGSCLIFKEDDCKNGKAYIKDGKITNIGFNLNDGDLIYSPIDGQLNVTQINSSDGQQYLHIKILEKLAFDKVNVTSAYDFTINGQVLNGIKNGEIKKGQALAKVINSGKDNVFFRVLNYNLDNGDEILNTTELNKYLIKDEN